MLYLPVWSLILYIQKADPYTQVGEPREISKDSSLVLRVVPCFWRLVSLERTTPVRKSASQRLFIVTIGRVDSKLWVEFFRWFSQNDVL